MWNIKITRRVHLGVLVGTLLFLGWGNGMQAHAATIDHFTIQFNPAPGVWTAGVPQWCTITAYEDAVTIANYWYDANLSSSLDHNTVLKAVSPQSIAFTNGVWQGSVTVYRASRTAGELNYLSVSKDAVESTSPSFIVQHNTASSLLIVESEGMIYRPGIAPDADPTGNHSIEGQPAVQTAGIGIPRIDFMLCDAYWNRVTQTAEADDTVTITCSEPYPARIEGMGIFVGGNLTVNLTDGLYSAQNTFKLFTVNGTLGHSIGVTNPHGHTPYTLGVQKNRVLVKHGEGDAFRIVHNLYSLVNVATAGVPFSVTVVAMDAYGNTLNSLNGALAFNTWSEVNLSAQNEVPGTRTIWPVRLGRDFTNYWVEGISNPMMYCYKTSVSYEQYLTASYNFGSGTRASDSSTFRVQPNTYARVVLLVWGMKLWPDTIGASGNYIYTAAYENEPPAASSEIFNNFGTPSTQMAGTDIMARAYTCDIYGNQVEDQEVFMRMTSTDSYSPAPGNQAVDPGSSYAEFAYAFHTKGTATITCEDATLTTITAVTLPPITIDPGAYYGLQVLAPGLVAIEGSGNTNVSGILPIDTGGWYSGVTPANPALAVNVYNGLDQIVGEYFAVTVRAVDMYGNYPAISSPASIELRSDDNDVNSEPNSSTSITGTLYDGFGIYLCQQRTAGLRFIKVYNTDAFGFHDGDSPDNSGVIVRIVSGPTPTRTPTPSFTPTMTPIVSVTPTATVSLTRTITPTPSQTPVVTATPSPTATHSATASATASSTPRLNVDEKTALRIFNNKLQPNKNDQPAVIHFYMAQEGQVTLRIYSIGGTLVKTLADQQRFSVGAHTLPWSGKLENGEWVASGVYIVHLVTPETTQYARLVVVK